jgi:ribosomal subunit interface protein
LLLGWSKAGSSGTGEKMELPVQITFKGLASSPALETRIRAKAAKLARYHERITSIRVLVESTNRHEQLGHAYSVRVDVLIPGAELFASREAGHSHEHEGMYVALRDAFEAVLRQMEHATERRRHVERV